MVVFFNGEFVREEHAVVPVSDRSFLYGDGLYETLPLYGGVPFRWDAHMERLQQGLNLLRIRIPFSGKELRSFATRLVELNNMPDAVLRLGVSRGTGPRGYSVKDAQKPIVVMTLHPLPVCSSGFSLSGNPPPDRAPLEQAKARTTNKAPAPGWRLITSTLRVLAGDPLTQLKTSSKVRSVLARAEAEEQGADEALLLNERGEITEGAATNFFCIDNTVVCTPPVAAGLLPGVTRAAVLEVCAEVGIKTAERAITPARVAACDGAFLTVSTMGVIEAIALDGKPLRRSPSVARIADHYRQLIRRETKE